LTCHGRPRARHGIAAPVVLPASSVLPEHVRDLGEPHRPFALLFFLRSAANFGRHR
jgi:hypothetical protein